MGDWRDIVAMVGEPAFDKGRQSILEAALLNSPEQTVTCSQVKRVVEMFAFDAGRVAAVRCIVRRCTLDDKDDFAPIVGLCAFDGGRLDCLRALVDAGAQVSLKRVLSAFAFDGGRTQATKIMSARAALARDERRGPRGPPGTGAGAGARAGAGAVAAHGPSQEDLELKQAVEASMEETKQEMIRMQARLREAELVLATQQLLQSSKEEFDQKQQAMLIEAARAAAAGRNDKGAGVGAGAGDGADSAPGFEMAIDPEVKTVPVDEEHEEANCVACGEYRINTIVMPCGHMYLCVDCGRKMKETSACATCRKPVTKISQVFLPR